MDVAEGTLVDETSQMSVDLERASDFDSVAQDELRSHHSSRPNRSSLDGDSTLPLVRALLESGHWDTVLPRHEKHVLLAATSSARAWHMFLDSCSVPSSSALSSTGSSSSTAQTTSNSSKRGGVNKTPKPATRSKRGTTTPRRRGADADHSEPNASDSAHDTQLSSREHIETLHTRLRTLISDVLVDEVLFPSEKHPEHVPLSEATKQGTCHSISSFNAPAFE